MAYAQVRYTGDGTTTSFSIPFTYLLVGHVEVAVAGAIKTYTTDYTISGATLTFVSAPAAAAQIIVTRRTSPSSRLTSYVDGATLTASALETDSKQAFNLAQEGLDFATSSITLSTLGNYWDATSYKISNVATPTLGTDAANKTFVETTIAAVQTSTFGGAYLPSAGGTLTGAVTGTSASMSGGYAGTNTSGASKYNVNMTGTAQNFFQGNVGIGTGKSTPSYPLDVAGTIAGSGNYLFSGSAARIQGDFSNGTLANRTLFQDRTANSPTTIGVIPNGTGVSGQIQTFNNSDPTNASLGYLYADASTVQLGSGKSGSGTYLNLNFVTAGSEAARIDNAQNFMVGRTSYGFLSNVKGCTLYNTGQVINETDASNAPFLINTFNNGVANVTVMNFYRQGSVAGTIFTSNGNTTTYGTSSDYRLKANEQPLTGSGSFIDGLRPKTWTWKSSGTQGVGFIAHEAEQVAPLSVNGKKDEVDAEGNPKYQSVGYGSSEIIANIVAELQHLRARVAALEAK
jgi:hypothetical protein